MSIIAKISLDCCVLCVERCPGRPPDLRPSTFQRANAVKREPELQAFWDEERIYERLLEDNTGEKYVLHDGPPYANGDLHIGHALNKVRLSNIVYWPRSDIVAWCRLQCTC